MTSQLDKLAGELHSELTEAMTDREEVSFTGFGKFLSQRRRARQAVNPRDPSQKIRVRAANVPKFRPGARLREAVSQVPPEARAAADSDGGSSAAAQTLRSPSSRAPGDWRPLGERQ